MTSIPEHPLRTFIDQNGLNIASFAALIPTKGPVVSRYLNRTRRPSEDHMKRIYEITGGTVTPNDFYPNVFNNAPNASRSSGNHDPISTLSRTRP